MPVKAPPTKTTCLVCQWSQVTHHRSDCLILPMECPSCGSRNLKQTQATGLEASPLVAVLQKILRS
ncbi:MAG: hypothetical protein AABY68_12800 [Pseudomonadota bacterium]|mgnify:CR=1 FL=1